MVLRAKYQNTPNFSLVYEDVLQYDFSALPAGYKIVANIPYYLTSQLLRILSDAPNKPASADLLMQKEVTQRVCASPPDMSILTVALQSVYATSEGAFVPAKLFTPPPKVDSLMVRLQVLPEPIVPVAHRKAFMRVVKAGFSAKRKTLRNTLSGGLQLTKPQVEELLDTLQIDPQRRAETLSLNEWKNLYEGVTALQSSQS